MTSLSRAAAAARLGHIADARADSGKRALGKGGRVRVQEAVSRKAAGERGDDAARWSRCAGGLRGGGRLHGRLPGFGRQRVAPRHRARPLSRGYAASNAAPAARRARLGPARCQVCAARVPHAFFPAALRPCSRGVLAGAPCCRCWCYLRRRCSHPPVCGGV
jgi:hypothetical protein